MRDGHDRRVNAPHILRGLTVAGVLAAVIALLVAVARGRRQPTVSMSASPPSAPTVTRPEPAVYSGPVEYPLARGLRQAGALAALIALLLMIMSAAYLRTYAGFVTLDEAVRFMLLGGGALALALLLARPRVALLYPARRAVMFAPWHSIALALAGALLLLALTAVNVDSGLAISADVQVGAFAAGVTLVILGLGGWRDQTAGKSALRQRDVWPLVGIVLLALAVRAWQLEDALHIFMDEMHFTDAVTALRDGSAVKILRPFDYLTAFPWVFPYMQRLSVGIFGPTLVGIRFASVLLGTLTVPALYLLARALFDRRVALLAAFLLAVFPPHIHFSRLGLNNIADPLFGTLALAFLAHGLKTGRRVNYALAGGMLGLTAYFYEGGRLLFPALVIAWLVVALVSWRPWSHWRGVVVMLLAALLIALPYYYTQRALNLSLAPRLEDMGHRSSYVLALATSAAESGWLQQYFKVNLRPALLHFIYTPDATFTGGNGFFYGGDTPLILNAFAPLFLLGVFWSLWRLRAAGALLALWVLLTAMGNSLLQQADWSARFVVAFPALPLIMAAGMVYTLRLMLLPLARMRLATWARAAAVLVVVALGLSQVTYYFGPHLAINNLQVRPDRDFHDVMFRARDLPPGSEVYFITNAEIWWPHVFGMIAFWHLDITVNQLLPGDDLEGYLAALSPGIDRAFFVSPADSRSIALLRAHFDGLQGPQMSPYNVPLIKQYGMYFAPGVPQGPQP